jgi:hypothetical protein
VALVFGFTLSGLVQSFLPRDGLRRKLGVTSPATVARASMLGLNIAATLVLVTLWLAARRAKNIARDPICGMTVDLSTSARCAAPSDSTATRRGRPVTASRSSTRSTRSAPCR